MTQKRLHILFICSWYPHRGQPVLGNFIRRHAEALSSIQKVSVVAAFSDPNILSAEIEVSSEGDLTEFIAYYPKISSRLPVISSVRKLRRYREAIHDACTRALEENGKPDIVHIHVAFPAATAVVSWVKLLKVPVVLTEHWSGYLPEDGNYKGMFLKHYTQSLFHHADHVTVVSDRMRSAMIQHGLQADFSLLPNTVNTDIFRFKEMSPAVGSFRFLHVSMMVDREKNISGLLRTFAKLEGHPELTLIGDGPEKKLFEDLAVKLGISERVHFKGLLNPEEIAGEMNSHDVYLMFSHFEGMPVTIIEAKCCGLPVIATATGAVPEMLKEPEDKLVEPGNESQLLQAMRTAVKQRCNKETRERISEQARSAYGYQAVALQLDSLYHKILSAE